VSTTSKRSSSRMSVASAATRTSSSTNRTRRRALAGVFGLMVLLARCARYRLRYADADQALHDIGLLARARKASFVDTRTPICPPARDGLVRKVAWHGLGQAAADDVSQRRGGNRAERRIAGVGQPRRAALGRYRAGRQLPPHDGRRGRGGAEADVEGAE